MKKWWITVGVVFVSVAILGVCMYGLPNISSDNSSSGSTNPQLDTTLPPETTEETLPWPTRAPVEYIADMDYGMEQDGYNELTRQLLPETLDNPDGLPVLKWVCLLDNYNYRTKGTMTEAAVVELNQMLADRNLPYRIQFTILKLNGFDKPQEWFANPEVLKDLEDADLIYAGYYQEQMEQWLLPITDHVFGDAQPSLAGILPDALCWRKFEVGGELYGYPSYLPSVQSQGWYVDTAFMETYDLTAEDFNRDFWEMDELFAEIYEKNGNKPFLMDDYFGRYGGLIGGNDVKYFLPMESAFDDSNYQGKCLCIGIDLQAEKPTVVNMLETELYDKVWAAAVRYLEAGYVSQYAKDVRYIGNVGSSKPYVDQTGEYCYIPHGPGVLRVTDCTPLTGISTKSSHTDEALSLLEQIMTDDALRLQLCYGKEGRDYTLEEGNVYTLIKQEDGSYYYMDYLSPQAYFFEYTRENGYDVSSTSYYSIIRQEGMNRLESYRADLAQASLSNCPIIFDYSAIEAELTAIGVVLGKYYPIHVEAHYSAYYEEYYPEMLEKLEEAGMSTVIAELQRQLDAWVAENPNWNPLS